MGKQGDTKSPELQADTPGKIPEGGGEPMDMTDGNYPGVMTRRARENPEVRQREIDEGGYSQTESGYTGTPVGQKDYLSARAQMRTPIRMQQRARGTHSFEGVITNGHFQRCNPEGHL